MSIRHRKPSILPLFCQSFTFGFEDSLLMQAPCHLAAWQTACSAQLAAIATELIRKESLNRAALDELLQENTYDRKQLADTLNAFH